MKTNREADELERRRASRRACGLARSSALIASVCAALFCGLPVLASPPDDSDVTAAVEDELLVDEVVSLNDIDVTTIQGVVTLTGTADSWTERERAAAIAETVRGVRSVVNEVEVEVPRPRSDAAIRNDVIEALLADAAVAAADVDVSVNDGTVALDGRVNSWQERRLAGKVAGSVRGVTDLINNLDWEQSAERSNEEIREDVEGRLRWDALVDDGLIDVSASGEGEVHLRGTVGSAAEKRMAEADAWVAGTRSVDASDLEVARWARDPDLRKQKFVTKDDEAVRDAVMDALLYDPRVDATDIDIDVDDGVVTLRGKVDTLKAKRAASQDARNTVGAITVQSRVRVRPGEILDDTIAEDVRDAIRRDPFVDQYDITTSVLGGTVDLYGTVDSYYEKAHADDVVSRVAGVKSVDNNLVVEEDYDPLVYDPYIEDWYLYEFPWYDYDSAVTYRGDMQILDDIQSELWWSPYINSDEVTVTVDDGVATLTGTVDTWSERAAAQRNAFEGGATWVDNDIVVETPTS